MRRPSIKALRQAFPQLDAHQAADIRVIMEFRHPKEAMEMIDMYLGPGFHGVEYIPQGRGKRSPAITYCNTGDSYGVTVLYVNGSYRVGAWGDILERGNYD